VSVPTPVLPRVVVPGCGGVVELLRRDDRVARRRAVAAARRVGRLAAGLADELSRADPAAFGR
jgi:hypothetical protein